MKVIGIEKVKFTTKDNVVVEGITYYLTEALTSEGCYGVRAEKVFFSAKKLVNAPIVGIGDEVNVYYNRFGKPEVIALAGIDR